ncbi:ribosomal protein S18-alanine N-acetyltransferase [Parasphingorhabdus sp.]|uniref:ribosomal protein S18-alanine N-acetyltransferase n=1 Tax=Parasphingorhabdus sp. TaxID=2709688 RepID=UPI003266F42B
MAKRESSWDDQNIDPVDIQSSDLNSLRDVMHIMERSFPKTYGESWNHHQCRSMLSMPSAKLLIARRRDEVCGFIISRQAADEEELLMIAVSPECQGKGVGYSLLRHMIEEARKLEVSAVFLEMRAGNPAENLYIKFGFEQIGLRKAYYTGVNMEKFDAVTYKAVISA